MKKADPDLILPLSYYQNPDVLFLANDLIGKVLCSLIDDKLTKGIISETEAYNGIDDKASHAYGGRYTKRTRTMYLSGGVSYVYLCYGIHHLFNVVTSIENDPKAVLIRGVIPFVGVDIMMNRRNKNDLNKLSNGPGTLSQAMGITTIQNAISLNGNIIWIEENNSLAGHKILTTPRIGVDYAGEDAALPYRFVLDKENHKE